MQWHGRKKAGGEREQNPIGGAYFADEAIDEPAQALVRELLQNARDAKAGDEPVRVRIAVSESADETKAAKWCGGLWPHLQAADSGVRQIPDRATIGRVLVVEDFASHGLTGRIDLEDAPDPSRASKERFYAFARAEGFTNKGSGGGGSWGVGKTAFPRASHINTIFGFSVRRENPHAILFGQSILRYRNVDGRRYAPEVMWGQRSREDTLVLPCTDPSLIAEFRSTFRVSRTDEPGLTIVIPQLHDDITPQALARHSALEYFLPILRGQMVVEIHGAGLPGGGVVLNQTSLSTHLPILCPDHEVSRLQPVLDLATWLCGDPPKQETVRTGIGVPSWTEAVPDDVAKNLSTRFSNGDRIALRVHVNVRRSAGDVPGYFDLFVQCASGPQPTRPVYVRDGIVIPRVRNRGLRGIRVHAILVCENNPLAELLRDAEGPGHTQWSPETETVRNRFKSEYTGGKSLINFVEDAPRNFVERLLSVQTERDTTTFADDFPAPVDEESHRRAKAKKRRKPAGDATPKPELPPKRPRAYIIEARKNGFVLRSTAEPGVARPVGLRIRVGYDITGTANPISEYHPADFKFNQAPIAVQTTGLRELKRHENVLEYEVIADDFRIQAEGFDLHRDIVVDACSVGSGEDAISASAHADPADDADEEVLVAGGAS